MAKDVRLYLEYLQRARRREPQRRRAARRIRSRRGAGLRRPDQQSRGRRDRRRRRRRAHPRRHDTGGAMMKIDRGRAAASRRSSARATFTGAVWADPVLAAEDGVMINNVFFEPGARTHWHTHERRAGAATSSPAGPGLHGGRRAGGDDQRRRHRVDSARRGALARRRRPDSYLLHLAISLGATTGSMPVIATTDYAEDDTMSTHEPLRGGAAGSARGARRGARRPRRSPSASEFSAPDPGARHRVLLGRRVDPRRASTARRAASSTSAC